MISRKMKLIERCAIFFEISCCFDNAFFIKSVQRLFGILHANRVKHGAKYSYTRRVSLSLSLSFVIAISLTTDSLIVPCYFKIAEKGDISFQIS